MRRDSIFYALFRQSPSLLFELVENPPELSQQYRFESVAVKEPRFEIDGVFLPPDADPPGTVFFAEVQMQKDERLYERMFGESMLYFYRNREYYSDWQVVVIYPSRSIEQSNSHPYRAFLNSDQVHRVYLNEIGSMEELPLGVAAMVLTITEESEAPEKARMLIGRANQEISVLPIRQGIIDIIGRILVYKFTNLSRQEIDLMMGYRLEDTRVYREAKKERSEEIALKMLTKDMSPETIAELTGLTIAEIQTLQSQLEQDS